MLDMVGITSNMVIVDRHDDDSHSCVCCFGIYESGAACHFSVSMVLHTPRPPPPVRRSHVLSRPKAQTCSEHRGIRGSS